MSYFLHHLHKTSNLELCRLIIFLCRDKKLGKKEDKLDGISRRPTFFRNSLAEGNIKNNGSKAKLFGGVQVYPKDFFRVVVYQCGGLAQSFLNA